MINIYDIIVIINKLQFSVNSRKNKIHTEKLKKTVFFVPKLFFATISDKLSECTYVQCLIISWYFRAGDVGYIL